MHCFMNLPTLAALGALVVASVASPAPAPLAETQNTKKQFTLERSKGMTADTAPQFIGVLEMCTGNQCNGPSTETWEIYGWPGSYGCLPVLPGWVTESVSFSQGIGYVDQYPHPHPSLSKPALSSPSCFLFISLIFLSRHLLLITLGAGPD